MIDHTTALWKQLHSAGIVTGELPTTCEPPSPWYVRLMLGVSGWIAALFLLGFVAVGLEFIVENEAASIITGGGMLVGAYVIFGAARNDFFEQFGLALSFAGQALMLFGLFEAIGWRDSTTWWIGAGLQLIIALVMPNFVQRLVAAYLTAYTLSVALTFHGAPYTTSVLVTLAVAIIWLSEFRWGRRGALIRPIGYGLTLALIQLKGQALFGFSLNWLMYSNDSFQLFVPLWLAQSITGLLLFGVVWQLLSRSEESPSGPRLLLVLLATALVAVVSLQAPGIATGFIVALLGFANSNRLLMGLGFVALLFYSSAYYYTLEETLLIKSQILAATGVTLLLVRWVMLRWVFPQPEANHA